VRDRIVVHTRIHFGKPCVAGTRVTVQNVLELVKEGVAADEICRDYYPDLIPNPIDPCGSGGTGSPGNPCPIRRRRHGFQSEPAPPERAPNPHQSNRSGITPDDVRACVQYAIDLIALEDIRAAEPA